MQAIPVGQDIESLAYHATSGLYVLGVTYPSQFQLPEDDWHRDWVKEGGCIHRFQHHTMETDRCRIRHFLPTEYKPRCTKTHGSVNMDNI